MGWEGWEGDRQSADLSEERGSTRRGRSCPVELASLVNVCVVLTGPCGAVCNQELAPISALRVAFHVSLPGVEAGLR